MSSCLCLHDSLCLVHVDIIIVVVVVAKPTAASCPPPLSIHGAYVTAVFVSTVTVRDCHTLAYWLRFLWRLRLLLWLCR